MGLARRPIPIPAASLEHMKEEEEASNVQCGVDSLWLTPLSNEDGDPVAASAVPVFEKVGKDVAKCRICLVQYKVANHGISLWHHLKKLYPVELQHHQGSFKIVELLTEPGMSSKVGVVDLTTWEMLHEAVDLL
ncbi:hypothetical protein TCAL_16085 [Tigriopus californicus]|uniref:Uncharacterized protein n=1 Tax=Tigriopus californicus TaxID=6832 RepID=A0A553PNJ7_TIGCA|nr:hypothetical protein TCAL_16085 [Tigriopus californicus]